MSRPLDPRFGKVVATMRSTTHEGERKSAEVAAAEMAARAGMTLKQALKRHDKPPAQQVEFTNVFAGFDDWMEEREPGYKARNAAKKSEKDRLRLERVAALVDRYGSKEAVLAPCARELKLRASLGNMRVAGSPPYERWTKSVDGCSSWWADKVPERVTRVMDIAVALPTTYRDAADENAYWNQRRRDIEDVLGPDGFGDDGLDLVAAIRAYRIRDLVERDLPITNLIDLHARFALYRSNQVNDTKIEAALFRDLSAIIGVVANG